MICVGVIKIDYELFVSLKAIDRLIIITKQLLNILLCIYYVHIIFIIYTFLSQRIAQGFYACFLER